MPARAPGRRSLRLTESEVPGGLEASLPGAAVRGRGTGDPTGRRRRVGECDAGEARQAVRAERAGAPEGSAPPTVTERLIALEVAGQSWVGAAHPGDRIADLGRRLAHGDRADERITSADALRAAPAELAAAAEIRTAAVLHAPETDGTVVVRQIAELAHCFAAHRRAHRLGARHRAPAAGAPVLASGIAFRTGGRWVVADRQQHRRRVGTHGHLGSAVARVAAVVDLAAVEPVWANAAVCAGEPAADHVRPVTAEREESQGRRDDRRDDQRSRRSHQLRHLAR
jgi:hypothetical protein